MQPQQEELASPQFERVNSFLDSIGRRSNNSPRMYATGLGYFDRFLKTIQLRTIDHKFHCIRISHSSITNAFLIVLQAPTIHNNEELPNTKSDALDY